MDYIISLQTLKRNIGRSKWVTILSYTFWREDIFVWRVEFRVTNKMHIVRFEKYIKIQKLEKCVKRNYLKPRL